MLGTGNLVSGFGNKVGSSGNMVSGTGNVVGGLDDAFMSNLYRSIMGTNVNIGNYVNSNLRGTVSKTAKSFW